MRTRLTNMALEWRQDNATDKEIIENVVSTLMCDVLENYELELSDHDEEKLERLLRSIVPDQIDWEEVDNCDINAREWSESARSAIYG